MASPIPANAGQWVGFDGSASSHGRPGRAIVSWLFDFGDGVSASGAVASHAYNKAGTYTATLTVTDDNVPPRTATAPLVIQVHPAPDNPVPVELSRFSVE